MVFDGEQLNQSASTGKAKTMLCVTLTFGLMTSKMASISCGPGNK